MLEGKPVNRVAKYYEMYDRLLEEEDSLGFIAEKPKVACKHLLSKVPLTLRPWIDNRVAVDKKLKEIPQRLYKVMVAAALAWDEAEGCRRRTEELEAEEKKERGRQETFSSKDRRRAEAIFG